MIKHQAEQKMSEHIQHHQDLLQLYHQVTALLQSHSSIMQILVAAGEVLLSDVNSILGRHTLTTV